MARQSTDEARAHLTSVAYRMLGSRWRVGRISDWVEDDGQLSSLISVRAELGRGDLRALDLGWLYARSLNFLKVPASVSDTARLAVLLAD